MNTEMRRGKRIVITTYGSFGDIHPYVALALELKARGHLPVIATSGMYREKIERVRLDFHAVRPDFPSFDQLDEVEEMMRRGMDARKGPEFIIKEMFMRPVRESYGDLREAARGADLLVTHPITFAGPVLAEKENIPWVSSLLSPISLFSAYDPIFPPEAGSLMKLFAMSPVFLNRLLLKVVKRRIANWEEPVVRLRAELGLPPGRSPVIEGHQSPARVLALFSKVLAEPRPDWPPQARVTGFCFYDRRDMSEDEPGLAVELQRFLDEGPPPLVFTLGSAAVWNAGDFYRQSVDAAQRLGQRAVLLIGDARNLPREKLPRDIVAFDYTPFGELLPRASVVVHQGGIGTTGQALRSGRPMLVVPHSHDQPDNGWRIQRLGVGRMLLRKGYKAARVARELSELLNNPAYAQRASEVGRLVQSEDGTRAASDLIEEALSNSAESAAHGEELIHAAGH
jgi:UDP:flavonoid glycosyltransferase YjiC (YdhE family)